MESLPEWTSLIVSRDVIPYDDLKIAPGYGRKLLLPDDIPPVLALPWALGPKVPRANRCQDDGSLNVFVVNQGGGGGGNPTPVQYTQVHRSPAIAKTGTSVGGVILPQVLTLVHISYKFINLSPNELSPVNLQFVNDGGSPDFTLCAFFADSQGGAASVPYVADIVLPFSPPWQLRTSNVFADSSYTLNTAGAAGDGSLQLDFWGYDLP